MSYVVPTNPVACISRQVAALVADLTVFAGLNVARVLDVLASTPACPDSRSTCEHTATLRSRRKFDHLHVLSSRLDEKCGLAVPEGSSSVRRRVAKLSQSRASRLICITISALVLIFAHGLSEVEAAEVCAYDLPSVPDTEVQAELDAFVESLGVEPNCAREEGTVAEVTNDYVARGYDRFLDSALWRDVLEEYPHFGGIFGECDLVVHATLFSDTEVWNGEWFQICPDVAAQGVELSPMSLEIPEGESRSYSVSLQSHPLGDGVGVPEFEVTVTPSSSNPDVTLSPASLTFAADNWQVAQPVTVTALSDDDSTDDVATISHAVAGYGDVTDGGEVTVTVTEPVPAAGVQLSPSALRVLEGGSETYTVSLESEPTGPVTVTPSSSNPDVTLSTASLTFTANDWQVAQPVTVTALADDDSTDDLATISHAVTGYGDVTDGGEVTVTVTEPVPAEAVQLSLSALRVREGGSETYTVTLGSEPTGPVTVEPQSDSQSVTVSPASLTFTSGNWNTPQPVTVRAVADDDTVEETVTITHSVTGFGPATEAGSIAVTVEETPPQEEEETAPQEEVESVTTTLATVTSSTVSNVATNIGTRFSAARAGTSLSLAGRTITLGDAYERTFVDQYGESFQNGEHDARDLGLDDVLRSAGFQIALGAADGTGAHPAAQWTLWGRGDLQFFSSDPSRGAGYDGRLQAGYFGLDVQLDGRWLAGVAVSRTSADADYSVEAGSAGNDGRIDVTLTSVLPYVRFAPDEKTDLWAILGAGQGEIENRRPNSRSPAENSDVTLLMASAGARRALATDGPLGWALLGDFNAGRVETDDGTQAIAGLTVDVWRTRLGVEGSYTQQLEDGVTLTSFMEMTGRHDGGDGEDQFGLELSPGLYLSNSASRIGVELRGRVLALNSADDYEEYGVSATVSVLPRTDGLGLSLSLAPAWGSAGTASASEFRRDDDFLASVSAPHERAGMSLNSRLGYGVAVASGRLTPFGEFSLRDGDRRKSRMGVRFDRRNSGLGDLSLELVGERGESLDGESDQRLSAAGRLRF